MKKITRSRVIVIAIIIIAVVAIVLKLKSNREHLKENIAIAQRTVGEIPVSIDTVDSGIIHRNVIATGVLKPSQVLTVVSETQGKIIRIYKRKGDRVKSGDVIVKVDDAVISANELTAEANYEQSQKDVKRLTRLANDNAVTQHDLEEARIGLKKAKADLINARKALDNTSITAPIPGYINKDFVTLGKYLGGGSPVCEIVNNDTLKVDIKLTGDEVYAVKKGQKVSVFLPVFPEKKFTGTISFIADNADAAMQFTVEITLENNVNVHLKSGLYAEVDLPMNSKKKLVINKEAIIGSMEKPQVYVAVNGKAEKRSIVIGQSNDTHLEVLSGLKKSELLIVSGQLNLNNGDKVKIVK